MENEYVRKCPRVLIIDGLAVSAPLRVTLRKKGRHNIVYCQRQDNIK